MFKKIGIQLYTVRDYMGDADSIRSTFRRLKELGYDEGQTAGCAIPAEDFGRIAREENFEICGTHDDFGMMLNEPEKAMERHRALGTTNMGVGGMGGYYYESREHLLEFIDAANKIGEAVHPYGFKFTYHNHSGEFNKFGNETMMDILRKGLNPETTSFVLDTYWVQHGGADVRHWIELLAGRIDILHLKDMKAGTGITEIGNGNLWWEEILKIAEATGVKHLVVEQDGNWCDNDSFKSAKISADYLAQYLDK